MEDNEYDTFPTDAQIRKLYRLGVPSERIRYMCRRTARQVIARLVAEAAAAHENYLARMDALRKKYAERDRAAYQRLQEMEDRLLWGDPPSQSSDSPASEPPSAKHPASDPPKE